MVLWTWQCDQNMRQNNFSFYRWLSRVRRREEYVKGGSSENLQVFSPQWVVALWVGVAHGKKLTIFPYSVLFLTQNLAINILDALWTQPQCQDMLILHWNAIGRSWDTAVQLYSYTKWTEGSFNTGCVHACCMNNGEWFRLLNSPRLQENIHITTPP